MSLVLKKIDIHNECLSLVKQRMERLNKIIDSAHQSVIEDTKSSAGDKYETNREMMEAEKEKASKQLLESIKLNKVLYDIKLKEKHTKVSFGSLVETSMGWFYISVPLGEVKLGDKKAFAISTLSPMGIALQGTKKGGETEVNGNKVKVLSVC